MMGGHHAISGAAAWVAVTGAAPYLTTGLHPLGPVGVFTGALVCAGAALLPDADHHNSTIAHSVPVVGPAVASAIETGSGGHRHGLHSLLAGAVACALSFAVNLLAVPIAPFGIVQVGAGIATMAMIAFAAKALKLTRGGFLLPWLLGAVVAAAVLIWAPQQMMWLPLAITLGYIVHLAGDSLTIQGVPLLWPWIPKPPRWWQRIPILNVIWKDNGYMSLPILGSTGSWIEWAACTLLGIYVLYALLFEAFWSAGVNLNHLIWP